MSPICPQDTRARNIAPNMYYNHCPYNVDHGDDPSMNPLTIIDINDWNQQHLPDPASASVALEDGKVLLMPQLRFDLLPEEEGLLDPKWLLPGAKNISYNPISAKIGHCAASGNDLLRLTRLLARYAQQARRLAALACPDYAPHLRDGLTSFRPVEVRDRKTSSKKDDTRLHIDAFASRPTGGLRILRVFHNLNPQGEPRVWELGGPMAAVAQRFLHRVPPQIIGSAWLMERLGIIKGRRSEYDHIMLHLHDKAKLDDAYQRTCARARVALPAHATWMVFTDGVEHAVLSGQYLLEQTFFLPVGAMNDEHKGPLRVLEQMLHRTLS